MSIRTSSIAALVALCGCAPVALAQSIGLDDMPLAPAVGPPGPVGGWGAENPFGLAAAPFPPLGPSPSLVLAGPLGDGAILSPGPVIQHPGPNGSYVDAFSRNTFDPGVDIFLEFSVDRVATGVPGTAVAAEAGFGQAHGDIYTGTLSYASPGTFAGLLGPGPFAGILPAPSVGAPGNALLIDESAFGLTTPAGIVPAGVPVAPPIAAPALHDNVDSYDSGIFDAAPGDGIFDIDHYFTIYPDEAALVGALATDIFVATAGTGGAVPVPYAPGPSMGLDILGKDSIDALVMFDNGMTPAGGAPGIEPGIDYALFSLAPGSGTLGAIGFDAGDIFYTDFTGAFALYAPAGTLGLAAGPGLPPFVGDNIDALNVIPAPSGAVLIMLGIAGGATRRRRR